MVANVSGSAAVVQQFSLQWDFSSGFNDSFSEILPPEELQPYWFLPVPGSLKIVLTAAIFGFMLKTKPPPANADSLLSRVMGRGKTGIGYLAKVFFIGMAVNCYIQDAVLIQEWGFAFTPLVILLSPNYIAALAIWGKLAKQSPMAALGTPASYQALRFLGPMAFPRDLGGAKWLSGLEQLYALLLLPYQCCSVIIGFCYWPAFISWCAAVFVPEVMLILYLCLMLFSFIIWVPGAFVLMLWHLAQPGAQWPYVTTTWFWVSYSASHLKSNAILFGQAFFAYLYLAGTIFIVGDIVFFCALLMYSIQQMGLSTGKRAVIKVYLDDRNHTSHHKGKPLSPMWYLLRCLEPTHHQVEELKEESSGAATEREMFLEDEDAAELDAHTQTQVPKVLWVLKGRRKNPEGPLWSFLGIPDPVPLYRAEKTLLMKLNADDTPGECSNEDDLHLLDQFKIRLLWADLRSIVLQILFFQLLLVMLYRTILRIQDVGFSTELLPNIIDCQFLTISERHIGVYVQGLVDSGRDLLNTGQDLVYAGHRGGLSGLIFKIWGGV